MPEMPWHIAKRGCTAWKSQLLMKSKLQLTAKIYPITGQHSSRTNSLKLKNHQNILQLPKALGFPYVSSTWKAASKFIIWDFRLCGHQVFAHIGGLCLTNVLGLMATSSEGLKCSLHVEKGETHIEIHSLKTKHRAVKWGVWRLVPSLGGRFCVCYSSGICDASWPEDISWHVHNGSTHKCQYQYDLTWEQTSIAQFKPICITNIHRKGCVPSPVGFALILPEHLPPSWQFPGGRPETLKFKMHTSEVSGWKLEPEKTDDFIGLRFPHVSFQISRFSTQNTWKRLKLEELSLRPYSYSPAREVTPREPETSKIRDVMCETGMLCSIPTRRSCKIMWYSICSHLMSYVATTWVTWKILTCLKHHPSLSCSGSTGRLKPCLRKKHAAEATFHVMEANVADRSSPHHISSLWNQHESIAAHGASVVG